MSKDVDDDAFVLPTSMLAPTYLWEDEPQTATASATTSTSEERRQEHHDNSKLEKGRSSPSSLSSLLSAEAVTPVPSSSYLAPFIATPQSDVCQLAAALLRLGLAKGTSRICDIGCGDGTFLVALCQALNEQQRTAKQKEADTSQHQQDQSEDESDLRKHASTSGVCGLGLDIDEDLIADAKRMLLQLNMESERMNFRFVVADICKMAAAELAALQFDGLYLYLYAEAMRVVENVLLGIIRRSVAASADSCRDSREEELKQVTNQHPIQLRWIVTRRWSLSERCLAKNGGPFLLMEEVAASAVASTRESCKVKFFVYGVCV